MVNVPRKSGNLLQLDALPGQRVSTNVPSGARMSGSGIRHLREAVGAVIQKEREEAAQIRMLDADRQLSDFENDALHDPEKGALNKRGKDSFGTHDEVMNNFEKRVSDISKGFKTDEERTRFEMYAQRRRSGLQKSLNSHIARERATYDQETTDSYLKSEQSAAVNNYQDDQRIAESIVKQEAAIRDHGRRNGKPDEWVEQKIKDMETATHTGVLNRMLANGQDQLAQEYYKANQGEITDADTKTKIEKALQDGSTRGESQRKSDEILLKHGDSRADATKAAKKIKDPALRDKTLERIDSHFAREAQIENQRKAEHFDQASQIVEETGLVSEIPGNVMADLTPNQISSLESRSRQKREGVEPTTNWDLYYQLKGLADNASTQTEFANKNLMEYRESLATAEFKELVKQQSALKTALETGQTEELDKITASDSVQKEIVNDALRGMGISPTAVSGPSAKPEVATNFRRKVREEVRRLEVSQGKQANDEQVQGIVDRLMVKGITDDGVIWDTEKHVFEMTPEEVESFQIDDIEDLPASEVEKIRGSLSRAGIQPTDKAIINVFIEKVRRERRGQ